MRAGFALMVWPTWSSKARQSCAPSISRDAPISRLQHSIIYRLTQHAISHQTRLLGLKTLSPSSLAFFRLHLSKLSCVFRHRLLFALRCLQHPVAAKTPLLAAMPPAIARSFELADTGPAAKPLDGTQVAKKNAAITNDFFILFCSFSLAGNGVAWVLEFQYFNND